jgi:single-strand DNA-binding protein
MANDLDMTQIIGNLGRDPEMRYLQNGTPVCDFSVAVNREWTDKNTGEKRKVTKWYKATAWNKLGEVCAQYLKKGRKVYISGDVNASAYMDKEGKPAFSLEIRVDQIQFLGGNGESNGSESPAEFAAPEPNTNIPF